MPTSKLSVAQTKIIPMSRSLFSIERGALWNGCTRNESQRSGRIQAPLKTWYRLLYHTTFKEQALERTKVYPAIFYLGIWALKIPVIFWQLLSWGKWAALSRKSFRCFQWWWCLSQFTGVCDGEISRGSNLLFRHIQYFFIMHGIVLNAFGEILCNFPFWMQHCTLCFLYLNCVLLSISSVEGEHSRAVCFVCLGILRLVLLTDAQDLPGFAGLPAL